MAHIATTGLNFSKHDDLRVEVGDEVPAHLIEEWMVEQCLVLDASVDWEALAALSTDERADLFLLRTAEDEPEEPKAPKPPKDRTRASARTATTKAGS